MNQAASKQLMLSAKEARDLHSEVYNLLAEIARLNAELKKAGQGAPVNTLTADGGSFR